MHKNIQINKKLTNKPTKKKTKKKTPTKKLLPPPPTKKKQPTINNLCNLWINLLSLTNIEKKQKSKQVPIWHSDKHIRKCLLPFYHHFFICVPNNSTALPPKVQTLASQHSTYGVKVWHLKYPSSAIGNNCLCYLFKIFCTHTTE